MFRKLALAALITVASAGGVRGQLPYLQKRLAGKGYDVSFFQDPRFSYSFQFPKNNNSGPFDYTDKSRCYYMRDSSILESIKFMGRELKWLEKAEEDYGVPKEIITAILNIETYFGRHQVYYLDRDNGIKLPALNALAKQYAISSGRRKEYFAQEIEKLLDIYKEFSDDPLDIYGSSMGALTNKQFMPSNIKELSVDHDEDGKIEHYGEADNIGSVGNFLKYHDYGKNPTLALMSYNYSRMYVKALKAHAEVLGEYEEKYGIYPELPMIEFRDEPVWDIPTLSEPPDTQTLHEVSVPVAADAESGKGLKKTLGKNILIFRAF